MSKEENKSEYWAKKVLQRHKIRNIMRNSKLNLEQATEKWINDKLKNQDHLEKE